MSPNRIQRKRTKGWKMPKGAVYVGRPTQFGNPFPVGTLVDRVVFTPVRNPNDYTVTETRVRDVEHSVQVYRLWLSGTPTLVNKWPPTAAEIATLRGKDLACWCALGSPCHADVILELANAGDA